MLLHFTNAKCEQAVEVQMDNNKKQLLLRVSMLHWHVYLCLFGVGLYRVLHATASQRIPGKSSAAPHDKFGAHCTADTILMQTSGACCEAYLTFITPHLGCSCSIVTAQQQQCTPQSHNRLR